GEGSPELVAMVKNAKNCLYHGFLDHHQVLSLTRDCDFVFAHYSPHRIINILAAPNKLAEGLALGRPVILNVETKVSGAVQQNDCGIVTNYGDVSEIESHIATILSEADSYQQMSIRARELFEAEYSWDVIKSNIVDVYRNLEEN
ncbi:glycosyltransferase, partial [Akkermansiaceae bacterium]|nr:glycosyltransferase [Akkermansiaceae bacterium]